MQIQVNTDSNIEGSVPFVQKVDSVVRDALGRFSALITRVEVHLGDENSDKKFGTEDKRCLLEVRLAGRQPISVKDRAATLEQAVDGAIAKMTRSLESTLGRLGKR